MINEMNGIKIADNIRAERNRVKINIEDTCKYLGISKTTYIEYEKNAEKIQARYLIKLAELFKCDIYRFFIQ